MDINYTESKDGLLAYACCTFCGYTERIFANSRNDPGTKISLSCAMKQHLDSCPDNPNRQESDVDKFIDDILNG